LCNTAKLFWFFEGYTPFFTKIIQEPVNLSHIWRLDSEFDIYETHIIAEFITGVAMESDKEVFAEISKPSYGYIFY